MEKTTKEELLESLERDYNAENWHKISHGLDEEDMLELTKEFHEHPVGFEHACYCQLCCSYGD